MVKAGALLYAVALMAMVTALTASVILLNSAIAISIEKCHEARLLSDAVSNGIRFLNASDLPPSVVEYEEAALSRNGISVYLNRDTWGLFLLASARAVAASGASSEKHAFTGSVLDDSLTLFLAGTGDDIVLSGNARIEGKVFCGQSRFSKDVSSTASFDGRYVTDEPAIPFPSEAMLQIQHDRLAAITGNCSLSPSASEVHAQTKEEVIFFAEPTTITSSYGRVMITSAHPIVIDRTCDLQDALVYAPVIIVSEGFKGSAQFFARDSLMIKPHVQLYYPSAAVVVGATGVLKMGDSVIIQGSLVVSGKGRIEISETSDITGGVFCRGGIDHQGGLQGMIVCQEFIHHGGTYQRRGELCNGRISMLRMPVSFTHPVCEGEKKKGVVKWL